MADTEIFSSTSAPIPPFRRTLDIIPIEDGGRDLLYIHDSLNYIDSNFALDRSAEPLLSLINGRHSANQISEILNGVISPNEILGFVKTLDKNLTLESAFFRDKSTQIEVGFEKSSIRKPALSGGSYPSEPDRFNEFAQSLLGGSNKNGQPKPRKGLFAPHIDLAIGGEQYQKAFSSLKDLKPERVVILATAHYTAYYGSHYANTPFIGSLKDFQLPGITFKTDKHFLHTLLNSSSDTGLSLSDRAHRVEHSIELHLLHLSAIWNHNFSIVPILVSGFDELFYHQEGQMDEHISNMSTLLLESDTDKTFYLISGDLSHVGKKFGDDIPASEMREKVEKSDKEFLSLSMQGSADKILNHIKKDYDSSRICGFSPLYTFLKTFPQIKGDLLDYYWWDEAERESAVSFGVISY